MNIDRNVERLIKKLREEQVVLFIGSGFSLGAGAPKVSDLISAIIENGGTGFADDIPEKERSLRAVSERFVEERGRNELISLLQPMFEKPSKDTSAHDLLPKIPHIRTIFTTNYDSFIEQAYPKEDVSVSISNQGCTYADTKRVSVYKIHGDLSNPNLPDNVVITDSDYKSYFNSKRFEFLWKELQLAFVKKYVVFIGYSLSDDNILDIIKEVKKKAGMNTKETFLVAPNLNACKSTQLKKNGVKYIDVTGEELLRAIIDDLKKNVVDDFKHRKVSKETYDLFLERNGNIYSTTTKLPDKNIIEKVQVQKGLQRNDEINFTSDINIKEEFENGHYNTRAQIPGTSIFLPAYKIDKINIKSFAHTVNSIQFSNQEDISSLMILPSVKGMDVTLRMKSIGFKEKVKGYQHREQEKSCIDIETPICRMRVDITKKEPNALLMTTTFTRNDSYSNSSDAIKWADFIKGMFEGKEFTINGSKINADKKEEGIIEFEKVGTYYRLVKAIEEEWDVEFPRYDNYTDENALKAKYIYYYHKKLGFVQQIPSNAIVSFEVDTRDKANYPIDKFRSDRFVMIQCDPLGCVALNGKEFNIPYLTHVFMDCKAKEIKRIDDYRYNIVMEDQKPQYNLWCSDEMPRQEGNCLKICSATINDDGKQEVS